MAEKVCDKLQLRQKAMSAATFTSLLGIAELHLGQVGVVIKPLYSIGFERHCI
jgi:hypothetical protein